MCQVKALMSCCIKIQIWIFNFHLKGAFRLKQLIIHYLSEHITYFNIRQNLMSRISVFRIQCSAIPRNVTIACSDSTYIYKILRNELSMFRPSSIYSPKENMREKVSSLNKHQDKVKKKYDVDCKYLLAKKWVRLLSNSDNSQ